MAALQEVVDRLRTDVGEHHDIPLYAVALLARGGAIKTTSGKLMRHACKREFEKGTLNLRAIWTQADGFRVIHAQA